MPVTLGLSGPTPLGDVALFTYYSGGEGWVLGERRAACWDEDHQALVWTLVEDIPYDNATDAIRGRPANVRWWWYSRYVKYSTGRMCGRAGWTIN